MRVAYIPEGKVKDFIQEVYRMSQPIGLCFLHYKEGDLHSTDLDHMVNHLDLNGVLGLDYVFGRQCKMTIRKEKETGKLYIKDYWPDHTELEFESLLLKLGMKVEEVEQ